MSTSQLPKSLRIGVIRGGPSSHYDDSLQTGSLVLQNLIDTHRPIDIFISNDGIWHMGGIEKSPENILKTVDVVFNGLHGTFGGDGRIQEILNSSGVKYTGSDRYSSGIARNLKLTKEKAKELGIKTPVSVFVRSSDDLVDKAKEIFNSIPHPLVVKPAKGGYSQAYDRANSFSTVLESLERILNDHDSAIVEEYIPGTRASSGVIEGLRNNQFYTLQPVEVDSNNIATYPTRFSESQKSEIQIASRLMHDSLGLRHYSTTDFIVSPRRGIYLLEVSTLPDLSEKSAVKKSLEAVGMSIKDLVHHLINLALNKE